VTVIASRMTNFLTAEIAKHGEERRVPVVA
jgi:hypothetical protein